MNTKQRRIIELVENMNGKQVQLSVISHGLRINVMGAVYDIDSNRFSVTGVGSDIVFQKDSIVSIQLNVESLDKIIVE